MLLAWLALSLAPQLELEWRAPAECPQIDDVRARVDRSWATDAGGAIEARGEITPTEDRARPWRLRMRLVAASGSAERELDGRSCDALADAAALMIAMAASGADDPTPVIPEPAPEPPPEIPEEPPIPSKPPVIDTPPSETATREAASAPVAPSVARRRFPRPSAELGIAGGFDAVAVPGLGATLAGAVGVHWPRLRVRAIVLHAIVRRVGDTPSARHRMTAGGLELCGFGNVRRWALGACGHAEVGRMHSQGDGGVGLVDRGLLWAAVGLGPAAQWRFAERWMLTGAANVIVPITRRTFSVGDAAVGVIGAAGVRLLVGLAVRLP